MNFNQKLRLFSDIYFCMDIMTGMVKEDISTTYFGSTWSRAMNKKLTNQPKGVVNQNDDITEWKLRGKF